jgi:transposase
MTKTHSTPGNATLVAVDIAKYHHDLLIEAPAPARRRHFRLANRREDYERLADYLRRLDAPAVIAFEATGNYHRSLAYFLHGQGFALRLIPTLALARTREAMHNSWDKNDPKDAQVILHLLKTGLSQIWHDPMINGTNDAQELSKTHHQVALARTRVWPACAIITFSCTFLRSNVSSAPTTAIG